MHSVQEKHFGAAIIEGIPAPRQRPGEGASNGEKWTWFDVFQEREREGGSRETVSLLLLLVLFVYERGQGIRKVETIDTCKIRCTFDSSQAETHFQ